MNNDCINLSTGMRPQLFLLYSLIIHSSINLFLQHSRQFILSFFKSLRHEKLFFHSFNMAKPATFFANFPVNKQPSTSEVIRRYRSTYERCDLVPLVTSSIGDSELIIHFQEAKARLFQIAITSRVFSQICLLTH